LYADTIGEKGFIIWLRVGSVYTSGTGHMIGSVYTSGTGHMIQVTDGVQIIIICTSSGNIQKQC